MNIHTLVDPRRILRPASEILRTASVYTLLHQDTHDSRVVKGVEPFGGEIRTVENGW